MAEAGGEPGVLIDAVWEPELSRAVFEMIGRRRAVPARDGRAWGAPSRHFRALRQSVPAGVQPSPMSVEQSNSSVLLADQAILKYIRRLEEGTNPGVELARFLAERAHFPYSPRPGGSLEYRANERASRPMTLVSLEGLVENEADGWSYVVDALGRSIEEAVAQHPDEDPAPPPVPGLLTLGPDDRLPDELRQARWLLRERDEFLAEREREADTLMEEVRARAEHMVSRTEVVRQANQAAQRILDDAREEARRMRHEAEDYCDQRLAAMEIVLERIIRTVQAGRQKLQASATPVADPSMPAPAVPAEEANPDGFFDQDLA